MLWLCSVEVQAFQCRALPDDVFHFLCPFALLSDVAVNTISSYIRDGGVRCRSGGRPSSLVVSLAFLSLSVQILGFCFNLGEILSFQFPSTLLFSVNLPEQESLNKQETCARSVCVTEFYSIRFDNLQVSFVLRMRSLFSSLSSLSLWRYQILYFSQTMAFSWWVELVLQVTACSTSALCFIDVFPFSAGNWWLVSDKWWIPHQDVVYPYFLQKMVHTFVEL